MKIIPAAHDRDFVVARLCSERLDNEAVKHYLKCSPTLRDFRNRYQGAFFFAWGDAFSSSADDGELKPRSVMVAEFDTARNAYELIARELDTWLVTMERCCEAIHGIRWGAQKGKAALVAIRAIEGGRNLARCQAALNRPPKREWAGNSS